MSVDTGDNPKIEIPKIDVSTLKTYPEWIYGAKNYDGTTVPDGLYIYHRNNNKTEPKTLDEAIQNNCVAFAVNGRSVYDFYFKGDQDAEDYEDNKLVEAKERMKNKVLVFCSQLGSVVSVQFEHDENDKKNFYPDTENLKEDVLLNPPLPGSISQLAKEDLKRLKSNKPRVDEIINAEIASASQSANQKKSLFSSFTSFFGSKSTSGGKRKSKKSRKSKSTKTRKSPKSRKYRKYRK
jgi:hypothetical protein